MSKQTPIKILEQAIKFTGEQLEDEIANIKTLKDQAAREEGQAKETRAEITSLQDALHKLKGLDNLEKRNKIADPAGLACPDYVISHRGCRIDVPELYDKLKKEATRRGE